MSSQPFGGHGLVFSAIQPPEKSGSPSRPLGAGAVMFGEPSAFLGMPAVGYFTHCAPTTAGRAHARASTTTTVVAASTRTSRADRITPLVSRALQKVRSNLAARRSKQP